MNTQFISFEDGEKHLSWPGLCAAFEAGHRLPRAEITDSFLYRGQDTLLSRAAWIDGMGLVVKTATIFPDNPRKNQPAVNGAVSLFGDSTGRLEAVIDFHLVTKWKTAGDSLFAARRLARPDSRRILLAGAGTVAQSLYDAYQTAFPDARFEIWNRTADRAKQFAASRPGVTAITDLEDGVKNADIIASATMSRDPLIKGDWLRPGQHLDLIGAFRADMREADDTALKRSSIFVDSFETTLSHIGELKIPLETGVIHKGDVLADFYQSEAFRRRDPDQITLFKNGGGAHLDLMTSRYILDAWADGR